MAKKSGLRGVARPCALVRRGPRRGKLRRGCRFTRNGRAVCVASVKCRRRRK